MSGLNPAYGIYPNPLGCDTMHMHHCLYPDFGGIMDEWSKRKRDIDNPGHGLALLTSQYTDNHTIRMMDGTGLPRWERVILAI